MPHFETEVGILVRILEVWFLKHRHIPCHYHLFPLRDYPVRDNPVRPPSVPPSNPNTTIALSFQFRLYGNGCNSRTAIRWGVRAGMEWPRASLPSLGHPFPALKCGCQPRISSNPLPEVWNGLPIRGWAERFLFAHLFFLVSHTQMWSCKENWNQTFFPLKIQLNPVECGEWRMGTLEPDRLC